MSRLLAVIFLVFILMLSDAYEEDPRLGYERCIEACPQHPQGRQRQCMRRCQLRYKEHEREQKQEQERRGERTINGFSVSEREEEREMEESHNPYLFHEEGLAERVKTSHGTFRVTKMFSERSELLKGIENYRIGIMNAKPQAFVVPSHWDADAIVIVTKGSGIAVLLRNEKKETINICRGDVLQILAGTTFFIVNKEREEDLQVATLFKPVNIPGKYKAYFGAGGQNPESFYKSFSKEVLEAAFNMPWDRLQRMFERRREGAIIGASEEQIREIVKRASSSERRPWPFASEEHNLNLFKKRPSHSTERGQLYEINPEESEELKELGIGMSFANLTNGAMIAPYYNSRATKIVLVIEGSGYSEMACPHLSGKETERKEREHEEEQRERGKETERKEREHEEEQRERERIRGAGRARNIPDSEIQLVTQYCSCCACRTSSGDCGIWGEKPGVALFRAEC